MTRLTNRIIPTSSRKITHLTRGLDIDIKTRKHYFCFHNHADVLNIYIHHYYNVSDSVWMLFIDNSKVLHYLSTLFLLYIKLVSKNYYRNKPVVGSFCFHYSSFTLEGHSTSFTCESVHLTVGVLLSPGAQFYVFLRVWSKLFKVRLLILKRDNNTVFPSQIQFKLMSNKTNPCSIQCGHGFCWYSYMWRGMTSGSR